MAEETEIEEETDEVLDAVTDRAMDRDPAQQKYQRERFRMTAADFEEERAEDAVEEEAEHEERNPNGKELERESEAIKRIVQQLRDQDIADRQQAAAVVTDWAQTPSEEAHRDEHMQELLRKLPEAPTAELQ